MVDEGIRRSGDNAFDADVCSATLGARRDWSDGTYTVTCGTCGTALREATDNGSGETVVLYRAGNRWMEWQGAPALSALVGRPGPHPRGSGYARVGRIHEREDVRDGAIDVRGEVREQG